MALDKSIDACSDLNLNLFKLPRVGRFLMKVATAETRYSSEEL